MEIFNLTSSYGTVRTYWPRTTFHRLLITLFHMETSGKKFEVIPFKWVTIEKRFHLSFNPPYFRFGRHGNAPRRPDAHLASRNSKLESSVGVVAFVSSLCISSLAAVFFVYRYFAEVLLSSRSCETFSYLSHFPSAKRTIGILSDYWVLFEELIDRNVQCGYLCACVMDSNVFSLGKR